MVIYDISLKMDVFYMQEYSETLHYAFLCHARKRKRKKKIAVTFSACLSISIPYFSVFSLQVDNTGEIFSVFTRVAEHTDKQATSVACQQASIITVLVQIHGFSKKPTEATKVIDSFYVKNGE